LIADDHPLFRQGLRQVIEATIGLKVVAEAEDGTVALAYLRVEKPDVAVLDIDMPGHDGFELARTINQERLPTRIIFLTMHKDQDVFNEALDLGVKGYIVKDSAVLDIVAGIKAVAAGQHYISSSISSYLVSRHENADTLVRETPRLADLTQQERNVLRLVAANKTSKEIAAELCISYRTVENHRTNICEKLELRGPHALLSFALKNKSQIS
jgi:DNA-binding NarL/FixJ family response regulator